MGKAEVITAAVVVTAVGLVGSVGNADKTARPEHPHFQFARNMDCRNDVLSEPDQHDRCLAGKRLPFAFDFVSSLSGNTFIEEAGSSIKELGHNLNGIRISVVKKYNNDPVSAPQADQADLQPATEKEVKAAAKVLQAEGIICPVGKFEDDKYTLYINPPKGQEQDKSAYLCLDTTNSSYTRAYDQNLVSTVIVINPQYKGEPFAQLDEGFARLEYEQCQAVTVQLRDLGAAAIRDTGKVAADHMAAVDLAVAGTGAASNTYHPVCSTKPAVEPSDSPSEGTR